MKNIIAFGMLGLAGCGLIVAGANASSTDDVVKGLSADTQDLVRFVENNPNDASSMARAAAALEAEGQTDLAAKYNAHAMELDPSIFTLEPADVEPGGLRGLGATGPDVWVCTLPEFTHWGVSGGIRAYSVATTSANGGDTILEWLNSTQEYPVIHQTMYRHMDGRLEMIGLSWLKHGFCALQGGGCGSCQPVPGGCPPRLGPGCSDPYSSGLNGSQGRLGPHDQVNASTAIKTALGTAAMGLPKHRSPGGGTIAGRLQVQQTDLRLSGATYFVEGQYVHPQDVDNGNKNNNASYRPVQHTSSFAMAAVSLNGSSSTRQRQQGIYAWQEMDNDVTIFNADVAGDGRYTIAYAVRDNGNGTWRYEYAVDNMDSDRSAQSFSVDVPAGVNITNAGFHDVPYHSGDGNGGTTYDGTDWAFSHTGDSATWEVASFPANNNANALRWGTMYNFWFDADSGPEMVNANIGLFKSGGAGDPNFMLNGPAGVACPWDLDGDGSVGSGDLAQLLGAWGTFGAGDLAALLGSWGACP